MEADIKPANAAPLAPLVPIASNERIQALDVVRGFALIGIFLMNIEYFNRAMSTMGQGMPGNLHGLDWMASYFVNYFVQGKFWTIFSMLFGMGFAVMLTRAERADRSFIAPYLRRILALAVFGAVHYIFIWQGDILFSYATAAGALMIVLYGRVKPILLAIAVLIGLGFVNGGFFAMAGGLAFVSLVALYMRSEKRWSLIVARVPVFSFILILLGAIGVIAATVFGLLPKAPKDPVVPLAIMGTIFFIYGVLSAKYREPADKRSLRVGVSLYLFMAVTMTSFGVAQYFRPAEPTLAQLEAKDAEAAMSAKLASANAPAAKVVDPAAAKAPADAAAKVAAKAPEKTEPPKTEVQKAAEKKAEKENRLKEQREHAAEEVRIFSHGSYGEAVLFRAREFPNKVVGDFGFSTVLIGMFLIGFWFVRSGIMENTAAHLPTFRKMLYYGLPVGIGLSVAASMIAMSHVPGDERDGYGIAMGLVTLANLPACMAYVAMVVLMLHSKTVFAKISVLAPAGRMALTNYLTQSLISTFIFYGYGLGQWGMSRSAQVLYVAVFFGLQIAFSHWWLARFRYGPMEWVWRAVTYRQYPAMRIHSHTPAMAMPA